MSWLSKIRKLLGSFWVDIFKTEDFITGLENLHALIGRTGQAKLDATMAGRTCVRPEDRFYVNTPFAVYIDKSSVQPAAYSYADVLNMDNALGKDKPDGGYVCKPTYAIPEPWQITDHVVDYTRTFIEGFDYDFYDGVIIMHVNPSTLDIPTVKMIDETGTLKTYYKLFGWCRPEYAVNDAVCTFESPLLADAPTAAVAWDIHQNGASVKNIKKLLGVVTDSVIADNDGTLTDYWSEQGYQYMLVSGKVYGAPTSVALAHNTRVTPVRNWAKGDSIKDGDVLFGTLKVHTCDTDPPASEIPSVRVRTDVGELKADNTSKQSIQVTVAGRGTVNILPLTSSDCGSLSEYILKCTDLAKDDNCPRISIPDQVNPFLFVMRKLRRGRAAFASITVSEDTVDRVMAALACIRRSTGAAGVFDTYVQATSGTVKTGIVAGFTAVAGCAAVSEDATVIVKSMLAEATSGI